MTKQSITRFADSTAALLETVQPEAVQLEADRSVSLPPCLEVWPCLEVRR